MEWHRHPLVIVLAALVAGLILYYVASPYQNCMRVDPQPFVCGNQTSW